MCLQTENGQIKKGFILGVCNEGFGVVKQIIGLRTARDNDVLKLCHEEYVRKVLSTSRMDDVKPLRTPLVITLGHQMSNHPLQSKSESTWSRCLVFLPLKVLYLTWCVQNWS